MVSSVCRKNMNNTKNFRQTSKKTKGVHKKMKHHKHISPATLTALLFLALLLLIEYPTRQSTLQHEISTQVLRFHIRANSDTPADQQKKLQLKQTLLTWLTPILSTAASKQETIKTIQQTLPEITKEANRLAAPPDRHRNPPKRMVPRKKLRHLHLPRRNLRRPPYRHRSRKRP